MDKQVKHLIDQLEEQRIDRRQFLRRAVALGLSLPAASAIVAACSPAPSPTAAPTVAPKPAAPAPAAPPTAAPAAAAPKPAPSLDIAKLVDGAKKEGALNWIDALATTTTEKVAHEAFKKKYGLPDSFKITHVVKGTGDVATTIEQEVKTGNVTFDSVWLGNLPFFQGLKAGGHLLAHESAEAPAHAEMVKRLNFPAEPPYWFTAHSYAFGPAWNKRFVKKDIKSYIDLLDPAFKGKSVMGDIRTSSTMTDTYIGLKKVLPPDFFQKYKDLTDPILIFRAAEGQQKLTTGERWVHTFLTGNRPYQVWLEDKSLEFGVAFPTEGMVPLPVSIAALAKAPHPNAARLWMEFILSKEAMDIWTNVEGIWGLRTDITYSKEVLPFLQPLDKIKTVPMNWNEITDKARDEARADFRKIFGVD